MTTEAWLTFPEAVQIVRSRFGTSIGRAEALVLAARESKEIRPRPSREPIYLIGDDGLMSLDQRPDLKAGRFSKDDFLDWLDGHKPRSAPASPVQAATPKRRESASYPRARAKQIINFLFPDGVPPVPQLLNGPLIQQVCTEHEADCKKRRIKYVELKRDTILRAAGRKK